MNSVTTSWGAIVVVLLIVVILGLVMLKTIASIFGAMFSRPVAGGWPMQGRVLALLAICVLGALVVRGFRTSIYVSADEIRPADQSTRNAIKQLSKARKEMQEAASMTRLIAGLDEPSLAAESSDTAGQADSKAESQETPSAKQEAGAQEIKTPESTDQENPAPADASANSITSTDENTPVDQAATANLSAEERSKRAAEVGGLIRSLLSRGGASTQPAVSETKSGVEGAESEDGGVMVFTLTPEDASHMFGTEMLAKLKSGMPSEVQAAFALVPLTSPVDSAVTPVKPFLAAGSLQLLADRLVTLLDPLTGNTAKTAPDNSAATDAATVLTSAPVEPTWVRKPDGGRMTVESKPVFDGADPEKALAEAVNEAYKQHAIEHFESLAPAIRSQLDRVQLRLDDQTAKLCIVDRYVRHEHGEFGTEGMKPFQIAYALVQFPEAVDQVTDKQLRLSMQNDRLFSLGLAVGLAWLSILAACFGVRTWTRKTGFQKLYTFPLYGLSVAFLGSTVAVVGASTTGNGPHISSGEDQPLMIAVPDERTESR